MAHASGMAALEQAVRDELRTLKYHFKTVKQDSKSGPKRCGSPSHAGAQLGCCVTGWLCACTPGGNHGSCHLLRSCLVRWATAPAADNFFWGI